MREILVTISFENHTLVKNDSVVVEGDYNSTKLVFVFEEDVSDKQLVFKMKDPENNVVLLEDLVDGEVVLVSYDEEGNACSPFHMPGLYPFEVVAYGNDSKFTSATGWLTANPRQVELDDVLVEPYLPLFDELLSKLGAVNISVTKTGGVATITVTDSNGRTDSVNIYDGNASAVTSVNGKTGDVKLTPEDLGIESAAGATFTPIVSENGTLSWTNDKGLDNPASVNIKGPKGDQGIQGEQGIQGQKGDKGDAGEPGVPGSPGYTPYIGPKGTWCIGDSDTGVPASPQGIFPSYKFGSDFANILLHVKSAIVDMDNTCLVVPESEYGGSYYSDITGGLMLYVGNGNSSVRFDFYGPGVDGKYIVYGDGDSTGLYIDTNVKHQAASDV